LKLEAKGFKYKAKTSSEGTVVTHSLDLIIIGTHRFADVHGVSSISRTSFHLGDLVSISEDFSSSNLIFLNHLYSENVVDFNVMSRDSVVEEVRREHHVVTGEPELGSVLMVEVHNISSSDHSVSRNNEGGNKGPHVKSRVVKRGRGISNVTR